MDLILLIAIVILLIITLFLVYFTRSKDNNELSELKNKIIEIQSTISKLEANLKEDFRINREENTNIAKENRIELNNTLKTITEQNQQALKEINTTLAQKVEALITKIDANNKTNLVELSKKSSIFHCQCDSRARELSFQWGTDNSGRWNRIKSSYFSVMYNFK